ncbi:MAG TPA: zinc ribbon domain-containing protein [Longimicrobiales bacterium]|nr:zinc ribbon domain-containing protein [Longimicrobiales bacterium]
MKCPGCGRESQGSFCPQCGTPLKGAQCPGCGTKLAAGARFCTSCGRPAGGRPARGNLGWYVTAGVLAALILVIGISMMFSRDRGTFMPGATPTPAAPMGGDGTPPPLTGTPREQGDRLFNRIMGAREQGDTAQAKFFAPMAIQAYQSAGNLDDDARFHLSMLQTLSGDAAAGLATAQSILAGNADHLLALAAAAEAAAAAGDEAAARRHWEHFLRVYDTERTKTLPEYVDHARIFPEYEAEARRYLGR